MIVIKKPILYEPLCLCCGAIFRMKRKDWKKIEHDKSYMKLTIPDSTCISGHHIEYREYVNTIIKCPICGERIVIHKERVD